MATHSSQHQNAGTRIEIFTAESVTITVSPMQSRTTASGDPESVLPSNTTQSCHAGMQTDTDPSMGPDQDTEDSYPRTILRPSLMYRPPLLEPGEPYHVIFAGSRVGIFGNWDDQVRPYVEALPGVHFESFATYEAALEAYTDAYNREEYSPQLKIVTHPNMEEAIRIGRARMARRQQKNIVSA